MRRPRAGGDEVFVIGSERLLDELEVPVHVGDPGSRGARHARFDAECAVGPTVPGEPTGPEVAAAPGPYEEAFEVQEREPGSTRGRVRRLGGVAAVASAFVLAPAVWVGRGDQRESGAAGPRAAHVASPRTPALPRARSAERQPRRTLRERSARGSRVERRPHKPERKPKITAASPAPGTDKAPPASVLAPSAPAPIPPPAPSGASRSSTPSSSSPTAAATGAEVRQEFGP